MVETGFDTSTFLWSLFMVIVVCGIPTAAIMIAIKILRKITGATKRAARSTASLVRR